MTAERQAAIDSYKSLAPVSSEELLAHITAKCPPLVDGQTHQMWNWTHKEVAEVVALAYSGSSFEIERCYGKRGYRKDGYLVEEKVFTSHGPYELDRIETRTVGVRGGGPSQSIVSIGWDKYGRRTNVSSPIQELRTRYQERARVSTQAAQARERKQEEIEENKIRRRTAAAIAGAAFLALLVIYVSVILIRASA